MPSEIALVLWLVVFFAINEVVFIHMSHSAWALLQIPFGAAIAWFVAEAVAIYATVWMRRKRLWLWGRNKFDNWDGFHAWFEMTKASDLEKLAGMEDDWWEPKGGGGYQLVPDRLP